METTHDCGPLPCERRYRLPGWTLLHRLLDHSAPHVPLATQPAYPPQKWEPLRFRRSSHSNLPADLGLFQILCT